MTLPQELAEEVRRALEAWAPDLPERLEQASGGRLVSMEEGERIHLFLRSAELEADLAGSPVAPDVAGLPLGTIRRGVWRPSLAGAHWLGRSGTRRVVRLRTQAAQRFLYGRTIEREGIEAMPQEADRLEGALIVIEPGGEVLGLGRLSPARERGRQQLEPIQDLGWYLREGG